MDINIKSWGEICIEIMGGICHIIWNKYIWTWWVDIFESMRLVFYILPRDYIERKYKRLYSLYRTLFDI